jgi:hypothetical protein
VPLKRGYVTYQASTLWVEVGTSALIVEGRWKMAKDLEETAAASIIRGLEDAVAFAQGDKTRGREITPEQMREYANVRTAALKAAIAACRAQRSIFLSSKYTVNQPMGSLGEIFACDKCIEAIGALLGKSENDDA